MLQHVINGNLKLMKETILTKME